MAETVGTSSALPVRQWPYVSRTRPNFQVSESDAPAIALKPAAYLPVNFMDMNIHDWIVLPKGTIVALDSDGNLVPANGGNATTDTYTMNDVDAGVKDSNGTLAVVAGTYTRSANEPIGVLMVDARQDIRGRYLNYKNQTDALGILCEYVIEVPYFTFADLGSPTSVAAGVAIAKAKIGPIAYASVTGAAAITYGASSFIALQPGNKVMSDPNGKIVKWDGVAASQVIGTVLSIDTDFPKDMLQHVMTYPYSETPGSETGGFPAALAWTGATKAARIRLTF